MKKFYTEPQMDVREIALCDIVTLSVQSNVNNLDSLTFDSKSTFDFLK